MCMGPPLIQSTVSLGRLQKDQSRSIDTEVESYKKAILKEQEENEQLTGMLRKLEADIAHVKKQVEASHAKREQLKVEYMTYTRTLQKTEEVLAKATTVRALKWAGWGGAGAAGMKYVYQCNTYVSLVLCTVTDYMHRTLFYSVQCDKGRLVARKGIVKHYLHTYVTYEFHVGQSLVNSWGT